MSGMRASEGKFAGLMSRSTTCSARGGEAQAAHHEQLTEALSNILLGEKIPLDVVNSETGEIIIPANRKITKTLLRKLAGEWSKEKGLVALLAAEGLVEHVPYRGVRVVSSSSTAFR